MSYAEPPRHLYPMLFPDTRALRADELGGWTMPQLVAYLTGNRLFVGSKVHPSRWAKQDVISSIVEIETAVDRAKARAAWEARVGDAYAQMIDDANRRLDALYGPVLSDEPGPVAETIARHMVTPRDPAPPERGRPAENDDSTD